MYRVTEQLLDDNNAIWSATPAFVTAKTAFSANITAISLASQQQQAVITGIATDKRVLKRTLVEVAAPIAAAVIAYASQTNNNELLEAVNYSQSDLNFTRDDMLTDRCQIIHNKANDNLAALADYGITAPLLNALQDAINAYAVKVPAPGTARQSKKTATINLRNLFNDTDTILKMQLDKLMLTFKNSHPDFYHNYTGGREIIDLGATHTKLRVIVNDQNGIALSAAVISLLQNNLVLYSFATGTDGKAQLTRIRPGTYTLRVTKPGFAAYTEPGIVLRAGRAVRRTVNLAAGSPPPATGTAIRENDLAAGAIEHINMDNINGTNATHIIVEAATAPFRVYAAAATTDFPGSVFLDVFPGTPVDKLGSDWALLLGFNSTNRYLMVQNIGSEQGHYKFTFTHLQQ